MKRLFLILISFFVLSLLAGGLLLRKGIHVKNFVISSATLTNIQLQWHSKLNLQIERLSLAETEETNEKTALDLSDIEKIIPLLQWVDRLFAKIAVQEITRGAIRADFLYASSAGSFNLFSTYIDLHSTFRMDAGKLVVTIPALSSEQFQSQATGEIRIDLKAKNSHGQLDIAVANSLPVSLSFSADQQQLSFEGQENGEITTITPFVDLFGLNQNIQRWITGYLTGSRYELKTFSGNFPWDNPLHLLESFSAEVRVEDCQYTFAPGLEAIKTQYTDIIFKQGVLGIVPHESTFYGQDGEDSWLDINFNDFDNILLTAYILTSAVANNDIMNLLEYYHIPLPFLQTDGKTKTDLILAITLNTEDIIATGSFLIDNAVVQYDRTPYHVENAEISLKNSHITIENMDIAYEKTLRAGISGFFDADSKKGDIDIVLHHLAVPVGDSVLTLDTSTLNLKLQCKISPEGVSVGSGESFWKWNTMSFHLGPFLTPLDFDDYSGVLPPTLLSVKDNGHEMSLRAELAGIFTGKKKEIELHGVLQQFSFKELILKSPNTPFHLSFNDGLTIEHTAHSQWLLGDASLELSPSRAVLHKDIFSFTSEKIKYESFFEGGINGSYDTVLRKGEYFITDLLLGMKELENLLTPEAFTLQLDGSGPYLQIFVPELGLEVTTGENKQWSVYVSDLKNVHDRSPLLQQFKIDNGEVTVSSADGGAPYLVQADILWHYPVLVHNNKPIEQYRLSGTVEDGNVQLNINEKVSINYKENIEINSDQISYNIPAISKFFKDCIQPRSESEDKENNILTTLIATDSGFYLSPDSQVIAKTVTLSSINNKIDIELFSGFGEIVIAMEGEEFSLQGDELDDRFMNALSPDAHIRNGSMTVAAKGKYDDFSVLIEVKKTVLENFQTLNNILAFVNTIPALITFNLPRYSSSGLYVTSAVAGMRVVDGIAEMSSMELESPELSITGEGWVDFPDKKIEMNLNLITQSKKNMNKIPLIGYILAGKKKHPSITVTVSGDLADPKVEHKTFKEVATLPFSILYRTLALPAHIVSPFLENDDEVPVKTVSPERNDHAK